MCIADIYIHTQCRGRLAFIVRWMPKDLNWKHKEIRKANKNTIRLNALYDIHNRLWSHVRFVTICHRLLIFSQELLYKKIITQTHMYDWKQRYQDLTIKKRSLQWLWKSWLWTSAVYNYKLPITEECNVKIDNSKQNQKTTNEVTNTYMYLDHLSSTSILFSYFVKPLHVSNQSQNTNDSVNLT